MTIFSANSASFNALTVTADITASNALITGTATVRELKTLLVTSSIIFESGSTKFGDSPDDTHQFTGSLSVLGNVSSSMGFSGSGANITNIPNSGLVNSAVTVTAGSGLSGGGSVSLGGTTTVTLDTSSAHFTNGIKSKLNTDGVISSSAQQVVATFTNGTDNRVLTATGATGINGESNLTFDGNIFAVNTNHLYVSGGNVGINTTNPGSYKLNVYGITNVSASGLPLSIDNGSTNQLNGLIEAKRSGTTRYYLGLDSSDNFVILNNVASSAVFTVVPSSGNTTINGNLGVAVSPSVDRTVYIQQSRATGTSYGMVLGATGASTTNVALYVDATGASNNYAAIFNTGNVGIGVTPTNAKLEVVATSGEVFRADAASGAYRIIANQTQVLLNGNVGIGTATPNSQAKLEVAFDQNLSTLGQSRRLILNDLRGGVNERTEIGFGYISSTTQPAVIGFQTTDSASSTKGILYFATRDVTTNTAPTERMRIDASGNVGIGVTTPVTTLNIGHQNHGIGFAYLGASNLPAIAGIFTDAASGSSGFGSLLIKSRSDFSVYSISFYTANTNNNPSERWRITPAGVFQSIGQQTIQTSTGNLTIATGGGNGHILLTPNGAGNVGIKTTTTSSAALTIASSNTLPYLIVGPNTTSGTKRDYTFSATVNSGQSIRLSNTTNIVGRASGLFLCKIHLNQLLSNDATHHAYGIFAFRVYVPFGGGTPEIAGLTSIANYGWSTANFTFTGSAGGTFTLDFANHTGVNTASIAIEIELLSGNAGATQSIVSTFTQSTI